jgi:cobalt-zinc-cadmium efflux system outer membrane protein
MNRRSKVVRAWACTLSRCARLLCAVVFSWCGWQVCRAAPAKAEAPLDATVPAPASSPPPSLPSSPASAPAPSTDPPSLRQIVEWAQTNAVDAVAARAQLDVAKATQVGAHLSSINNPYLEVFADKGTSKNPTFMLLSNLWIPVELAGQRGKRIDESNARVDWQRYNMRAAHAMVAADAIRAWGNVVVARKRNEIWNEVLKESKAEAEWFRKRLELGDATLRDARMSDVEVGRNLVALESSIADSERALADLKRLAGRDVSVEDVDAILEPPSYPALSDPNPQYKTLAERSPWVAALEKQSMFHVATAHRAAREAHVPVNLILTAGRGEFGEARYGGGASWTFPTIHRNQGQQAVAYAERTRVLKERDARVFAISTTLSGLHAEYEQLRQALHELTDLAEPAAVDTVKASVEMQRSGKGDLLPIITARRDLALLRIRRMDLLQRAWSLVAEAVALTGVLP